MKIKLTALLLITIFLVGCSKKSEEEYLSAAEKLMNESKYTEAIAEYEKYINDYPEGKNTSKAYFEIAKIYQAKLVNDISSDASFQKSIEYYQKVVDNFSSSLEAPLSLFMIGFIQANELKKYDLATATYNLFIKKYPEHQLVESAREELNNMGLSPDEILKRKVVQE